MITHSNASQPSVSVSGMSALEAIYHRRSVRNFTPRMIEQSVIRGLLDAAVHAPTAMHQEPWSFVVIQNRKLLDCLAYSAKAQVRQEAQRENTPAARHLLEVVAKPDFEVFYNAGTLIVIYGRSPGSFVEADCWLAAENLMLAACAQGLGTCVIGLAIGALNSREWKAELRIPQEMTAIVPLILGVPTAPPPKVPRKDPIILAWR